MPLRELWLDESGMDNAEYALIAALVAVAAIVTVKDFGKKSVAKEYNTISTDFIKDKAPK